ncbi:hypothetical protein ACFSYG_18920 [Leeuwenhoekiella polynyae]|uniref:hypothetical protein n=1 Tax=Leeuwenhoekiella polynyae TaxID=1550906 RepID=UPI000FFF1455|nr:hypothetical protein [Leeuwenhoekiella polynyae]
MRKIALGIGIAHLLLRLYRSIPEGKPLCLDTYLFHNKLINSAFENRFSYTLMLYPGLRLGYARELCRIYSVFWG